MASDDGDERARALTVDQRYVQMCMDIRFTDEVSLKLLALVPLVSGAGILTALFAATHRSPSEAAILAAFIGVFGAITTFAIYRWEVRNSQFCSHLIRQVTDLEGLSSSGGKGHYLGRPEAPTFSFGFGKRRVGKTEAERILYVAVILSWLALPGV